MTIWKPYLNKDETNNLLKHGYMIRSHWIMPGKYYEHYLIRMGGNSATETIFTAKSPRACYNYGIKKGYFLAINNKVV